MTSQLQSRPWSPTQPDAADDFIAPTYRINPELSATDKKGIYDSEQQLITLGQKIGAGGQGTVYEIHGRADVVAKIYHEAPAPPQAEKLIALTRHSNERLLKLSAWPVDVLRAQPSGQVIGFVMQKIEQAAEVHTLHSPKSRLRKFPEASWAFLVHTAANIARAVAVMHEHNLVIGDMNPKNILVTKKGTVYLLDCDSFQIAAEGKTFRCDAGFPEYTPPELQGIAFKDIDRNPEHDNFGLAVVIFQLLFLGRHPFSGRFSGAGEMPLEQAIRELRYVYGADANQRQMQPPPGTLTRRELPHELMELFERAFVAPDRPNPREWIAPLETLARNLKKCMVHSGHYFYEALSKCPWCEIETRSRVRLFNFLLAGTDSKKNHFRLHEVWQEVQAIRDSTKITALEQFSAATMQPSEQVENYLSRRKQFFAISMLIAALFGVLTPLLLSFSNSFNVLFFAIVVIHQIVNLPLDFKLTPLNFFSKAAKTHGKLLIEQYENLKTQAYQQLVALERSWDSSASGNYFNAKFEELSGKKETYEKLAELRKRRLKMLELNAYQAALQQHLQTFRMNDNFNLFANRARYKLQVFGIYSAADVSETKLQKIDKLKPSIKQKLLTWRNELESAFTFDPRQAISAHAIAQIDKEVEELKVRLESELSSAAFYLRRLKQQFETNEAALRPQVVKARHDLAQAEKDLELISQRPKLWPAIVILLATFLVVSGMQLVYTAYM